VAIYSLHHTPVGKSTQAQPYTAAAHTRYITRKDALSAVRGPVCRPGTPREVAREVPVPWGQMVAPPDADDHGPGRGGIFAVSVTLPFLCGSRAARGDASAS